MLYLSFVPTLTVGVRPDAPEIKAADVEGPAQEEVVTEGGQIKLKES